MNRRNRRPDRYRMNRTMHSPATAGDFDAHRPREARRIAAGTLAATGFIVCVLAPGAQALSVGDIAVESVLGQPLRARIPVQLAAGETLGAACNVTSMTSRSDIGTVPGARFTVPEAAAAGRYELAVSTPRPLYEPMYELHLQLRCPGAAVLVRQYVLMLDLPGMAPAALPPVAAAPTPAQAQATAPPPAAPTPANPSRRTAISRPATPLAHGTAYRVQAGDTLSTIAARVTERNGRSLWRMAEDIFAANPGAFIDGNRDLIRLGADIVLPEAAMTPAGAPGLAAAQASVAPPADAPPALSIPDNMPVAATALPPETAAAPEVLDPASTAPAGVVAANPEPRVFVDEQIESSPAPRLEPAQPVAAPTTEPQVPAWLAALVGLLVGTIASVALLREKLLAALRRPAAAPLQDAAADATPGPVATTVTPAPVRRSNQPEPAMLVEESAYEHDVVTNPGIVDREQATPSTDSAEATAADDLAQLFDPDPVLAHQEPSPMTGVGLDDGAHLDLDLSSAAADVTIDQEIGWFDGDETALTPTAQSPALAHLHDGDTVDQATDLQTLSQQGIDDQSVSDTLKEALDLLESDYEDELTASHIISKDKLSQILDGDSLDDDDSLIRTGTDQIPRPRR